MCSSDLMAPASEVLEKQEVPLDVEKTEQKEVIDEIDIKYVGFIEELRTKFPQEEINFQIFVKKFCDEMPARILNENEERSEERRGVKKYSD